MKSEAEIRRIGMEALIRELGDVEAEIFIKNLLREPFDYTEWQKDLWADKSVKDIFKEAGRTVNSG